MEIYSISKDKNKERVHLIKLVIQRVSRRVDISNIMIPFDFKYNGFGKKLILETFHIAQNHSYKLYLVQMVEGFYNRMVRRGAKIIVPHDVVEITEKTKLT